MMAAMVCETRRCRGRGASGSSCHFVGRHPRACNRHPGDGPAHHDVVGRYYDPQTGQFLSVDAALPDTHEPFEYAEDNPVAVTDPTGAYAYHYYWDLGRSSVLGSPQHVFHYFSTHVHSVFPFPTGTCNAFWLGEHCAFKPGGGTDYLHVSALSVESVSLTVDSWCYVPIVFGICVAGDPPGSKITFAVTELTSPQSGRIDVLSQVANAPGASPIANWFALHYAVLSWSKQADNLSKALGGPGAALITNISSPWEVT
jgi:RHS repeat-associated protein